MYLYLYHSKIVLIFQLYSNKFAHNQQIINAFCVFIHLCSNAQAGYIYHVLRKLIHDRFITFYLTFALLSGILLKYA